MSRPPSLNSLVTALLTTVFLTFVIMGISSFTLARYVVGWFAMKSTASGRRRDGVGLGKGKRTTAVAVAATYFPTFLAVICHHPSTYTYRYRSLSLRRAL